MTGNPPDDSTSPVPAASGPGPHDAARPRERLLPSVPAAERTAARGGQGAHGPGDPGGPDGHADATGGLDGLGAVHAAGG